MKAKTIDNSPYGWDSLIFDDSDQIIGSWIKGFHDKKVVDKCTELFNRELSAHVAKETAPLLAEIDRLKKEVEKFEKENDRLRVAYKSLERKLNVASESLKEANEFLNDPKKLGEYIAGM